MRHYRKVVSRKHVNEVKCMYFIQAVTRYATIFLNVVYCASFKGLKTSTLNIIVGGYRRFSLAEEICKLPDDKSDIDL